MSNEPKKLCRGGSNVKICGIYFSHITECPVCGGKIILPLQIPADRPTTEPLTTEKTYLGDSVYAEDDGYHIILTTFNGRHLSDPSNVIYLDPCVYAGLVKFVSSRKCMKSFIKWWTTYAVTSDPEMQPEEEE